MNSLKDCFHKDRVTYGNLFTLYIEIKPPDKLKSKIILSPISDFFFFFYLSKSRYTQLPGWCLKSECVSCSVVSDSANTWTVCSLPGSSVHEILQARILKWVAIPSSRGSYQPRYRTCVSCIAGRLFTV